MKISVVVAMFFMLPYTASVYSQTRTKAMVGAQKVCGHGAVLDVRIASEAGLSKSLLLGVQLVYTPWANDLSTPYLDKQWASPGAEPYISLIGIKASTSESTKMFEKIYDVIVGAFALGAPVRIVSKNGLCDGAANNFDVKLCGKAPCLDEGE